MNGGSPPAEADATKQPAELSIARGSAFLVLASTASNAGYFVAVLFLARNLTPAERGTVAFVTVTAVVVARAFKLGVDQALTVFAAQRPEARPALLSNMLVFGLPSGLVGGIAVSSLLLIGGIRPSGVGHAELVVLVLATLSATLMESGFAFLDGLGRFRQIAPLQASGPWIYAAILGALWAGPGVTIFGAVVAWAVAHGLEGVALCVSSRRWVGLGRPDRGLLRESLAFGVRAWPGTLARFLNFRIDQVLMGFISTEAALGIYAIAVNLSEVSLYLPGAVSTALIPVIARVEAPRRVERTAATFRMLFVLTLATIGAAALIGPPLLPVLFGRAYSGSIVPFLCLLPGAAGFAASGVFSSALLSSSRPGLSSIGPLVSLVVGFAIDLALIPPLGATGAAIAASVAFIAGGATAFLAAWRVHRYELSLLVPRFGDVVAVRDVIVAILRKLRGGSAGPDPADLS